MATIRRDMDRAFSAGDPEALLDLLAIQSLRKRRSGDDVTKVPLPSFAGDTDMDALVRDLTIDDAIARTFADLPPSGDPPSLNLTTASFTFKPERKLMETSSSAKSSGPSASWQPAHSYMESQLSGEFPAAFPFAQQAQVDAEDSAGESGAGTKSRGFLAGLLSRAVKGRGKAENAGRKSKQGSGRQNSAEAGGLRRIPADGWSSSLDAQPKIMISSTDGHVPSTSSKEAHNISARAFHGAPVVSELLGTSMLAFSASSEDPTDNLGLRKRTKVPQEEIVTVGPNSALDRVRAEMAEAPRNAKAASTNAANTWLKPEEKGTREVTLGVLGQASDSGGLAVNRIPRQTVPSTTALEQSVIQTVGHQQLRSEPPLNHQRQHNVGQGQDESVGILEKEGVHFSTLDKDLTTARSDSKLWANETRLQLGTDEALAGKRVVASRPKQSSVMVMEGEKEGVHPFLDSGGALTSCDERKGWDLWLEGVETFIDFERDPEQEIDIKIKRNEFAKDTVSTQNVAERQTRSEAEPLSSMASDDTVVCVEPLTSLTAPSMTSQVQEIIEQAARPLAKDSRSHERGEEKVLHGAPPTSKNEGRANVVSEGEPFTWVNTGSASKAAHSIEKTITQLSALAFCSSCRLAASRIKADLENALKEMRGTNKQYVENNGQPFLLGRHPDAFGQNNGNTARDNVGPLKKSSGDFKPEQYPQPPATTMTSLRFVTEPRGAVGKMAPRPNSGSEYGTALNAVGTKPTAMTTKGGSWKETAPVSDMTSDSDSGSTSTVTPLTLTTRPKKKRKSLASAKSDDASRYDRIQSDGKSVSAEDSMINTDSADSAPSSQDMENQLALGHQKTTSDGPVIENAASSGDSARAENRGETAEGTKSLAYEVHNTSPASLPNGKPSQRTKPKRVYRYAGAADVDNESQMTSTWSEMTSVSSVSDPATSADESSYYSGDDDADVDEEDDDEDDEEDDDDIPPLVRLGLENEDHDESGLRHERLQRHLSSVLRQSGAARSAPAVETVVAATGERLSLLGRSSVPAAAPHVNEGAQYPFAPPPSSVLSASAKDGGLANLPAAAMAEGERPSGQVKEGLLASMLKRTASSREGRASNPAKRGGASPRLFSPDRQVALVAARQMTSNEFRESYDRSMDAAKVKRSQLDSDIPWDMLQFSDTDDDTTNNRMCMDITSEEEKNTNSTDSDSSMLTSDW